MNDELTIRLPCKIGAPVYRIVLYDKGRGGFIWQGTCAGIHITDSIGKRRLNNAAKYLVVRGLEGFSNRFRFEELGVTLFTKREDAEKALREVTAWSN